MLADISTKIKPGKSIISKRQSASKRCGESLGDLSKEGTCKRSKLEEQNRNCAEEQESSFVDNREKLSTTSNDCSQSNELASSPKARTASLSNEQFVKSSKYSVVSNEEVVTPIDNPVAVVSDERPTGTNHNSLASFDHSEEEVAKTYKNIHASHDEQVIKDSNFCSKIEIPSLKDFNSLTTELHKSFPEKNVSTAHINKNKLVARSSERNTVSDEQHSEYSKESVVPLDTASGNPKILVEGTASPSGDIAKSFKLKSIQDSEVPKKLKELDKSFESKTVSYDTRQKSPVMTTAEPDKSHVEKDVKKIANDNDVKRQTFERKVKRETSTKTITDNKVKIKNDHQKIACISANNPASTCTTFPLLSQTIEDQTRVSSSIQLDTNKESIDTKTVVYLSDAESEENDCNVPVTVILSDEKCTNKEGNKLGKKKNVTSKGKKLHKRVSEQRLPEKYNKRPKREDAASLPIKENREEYQCDESVNAKCGKFTNKKETPKKQCCRKQCRKNEFDGNISNLDTENLKKFVETAVDVAKCATKSADRGRLRNARRTYTLPDTNNHYIRVCKTAFMETLKISSDFIDCALKNKTNKLINGALNKLQDEEKQAHNKNDNKTNKHSAQLNDHDSNHASTSRVQIATSDKEDNNESQAIDCTNIEESTSSTSIVNLKNNHMRTDAGTNLLHASFDESRGTSSQGNTLMDGYSSNIVTPLPAPIETLTPMLGLSSDREIGIPMSQNTERVQDIPTISSNASAYGGPVCNITGISSKIISSRTADVPNFGIFSQSLNYNYSEGTDFFGVSTQNSGKPIAKVVPSPSYMYVPPTSPIPDVHQQNSVIHNYIHPTSTQTPMFDINNPQMSQSRPFTPQRQSETTNQGYLSMLLENTAMDFSKTRKCSFKE